MNNNSTFIHKTYNDSISRIVCAVLSISQMFTPIIPSEAFLNRRFFPYISSNDYTFKENKKEGYVIGVIGRYNEKKG